MSNLWVFGYGSLVWRPSFDHVRSEAGFIRGWARRFWQASTDHRGVPEAPGRVVTLVAEPGAECWGRGFLVAEERRARVLAELDHREKGGYGRHDERLTLVTGEVVDALVYVAEPGNPNYVGPAPLEAIAGIIRTAVGPSGANLEYILRLDEALRAMGAPDPHVSGLVALLEE